MCVLSVECGEVCCYSCHETLFLQFRVCSLAAHDSSLKSSRVDFRLSRLWNDSAADKPWTRVSFTILNLSLIDFFCDDEIFVFNFLSWQMTFIFPLKSGMNFLYLVTKNQKLGHWRMKSEKRRENWNAKKSFRVFSHCSTHTWQHWNQLKFFVFEIFVLFSAQTNTHTTMTVNF